MLHLRIPALIALLSALLLMGCARPKVAVPASLLQCQPQPALELAMDDHAIARWLLDVVDAGEDCRAKLRLVRGLVAP
jgi:type IV pilus biogenesis protein CpaD/CtpE